MNWHRLVIVAGWSALCIVIVSSDVAYGWAWGHVLDSVLVIALWLMFSGRISLAFIMAVTGGLFRSSMSALPWMLYPVAYVLALGVGMLFIRRVMTERSIASLIAISITASVVFPLCLLGTSAAAHALWPTSLQAPTIPWLMIGAWQVITQPLVLWVWWRWRTGGHFARIDSSTLQPF